ncbi:MAG: HD domain-containing phosphohydrolase [Candidatus Desulfaltia sp.]|nr:HD domain-containing phosphohydrolase [Candidatus Desulfaltia sp.]
MTSSSDFDQKINNQQKQIKQLAEIGLALSGEKNINKLLEMIIDEARDLSNADAGTLYTVDGDKLHLSFEIMQNDSMKIRMGGTSGNKITLPKVPLYINGRPNHSNVSSYTALTGETINIPDVYKASGFDFTGPRKYDATTGYRSKSMLVIPMKNHENDIIGVLQLLNAKNIKTGKVVSFPAKYVNLIASLASQAAIVLTNTQLIHDLKNLFYSFIKSIATAIDEKSPYTGGHIRRVVFLTMMIAEEINKSHDGPFKDIYFNEDEIEELRLAAWMHDVGKITTPEHVVDKSTKLETIYDRIFLIETRFNLIAGLIKKRYLKQKIELLINEENSKDKIKRIEQVLGDEIKTLYDELDFIKECNKTKEFMDDDKIKRVKNIAKKTYSLNNEEHYYLTEDEVKNLCIRKGTLTEEERKIVENHAEMTLKILKQIPFPKKLANVPKYAASHHEKLDGSGYPRGLTAKEMPFQLRIMVIADIFEALTAKDRPYKQPINLSLAIKIMEYMKKDKHIDSDIYDLFIKERLFYDYAKKEMFSEQIDM